MKKHYLIYSLLILVFGIGFMLSYRTIRNNEIKTKALHESFLHLNSKERILENNAIVQVQFLGRPFSDSLFFDEFGKEVTVDSLFATRKLCMYIGPEYCSKCVSQHIETIKKYIDNIGAENIVFIFRNISRRDLRYFKISEKITSSCIVGEYINPFDTEDPFPLFFTMDKNLILQDVFIPLGNSPDYNERYLKLIVKKYYY